MRTEDFDLYGIRHFVPGEVTRTGARLEDVSAILIWRLDEFRHILGVPVVLLSLTTGEHYSEYHPSGLAADVAFHDMESVPGVGSMHRAALDAGFRGIGIYHNGISYSMHLDLRPERGEWVAWKRHRESSWNFGGLTVDPSMYSK